MNRQLVHLASFAIVIGLSQSVVLGQPPDQIVNGEFDDGLNSWRGYGAEGFTMQVVPVTDMSGANAVLIDITDAAATASIGIAQAGFVLEPGVTYPIGFTAKAAQNRDMVLLLQGTVSGTWPEYVNQTISLTTSPQTYVFEYTHSGEIIGDDAGESVDLYLMLKGTWWPMGGDTLNTKVWFDRVYFGAEPPPPRRDLATNPSPADQATDVPRDVILAWTEGEFADTHDVYFGTVFDDVNAASGTDDRGVLVGPGQSATSYVLDELLEYGQTYYWRVDEVNAPPDSTVFPGPVWSFTVEPFSYPVQNVTATASSSSTDKGMTPDKTVDGSGMTGDEHSTQDSAMWLSAPFTPLPAWIQYEFDDVYKLSELWVWNSNQTIETYIGFGARNVTVEYSRDGVEWASLGDVEFAQAPGDVGYTPNTTVDMAGVQAKFVRLTIQSNWSLALPQVGLSEVRFYYVPVKAWQPNPASGAADVPLDTVLTWRSGREAASHEVYFNTDKQAVVDGTAPAEAVSTTRLEPSGMNYGQDYYWKVNEISDDGTVYEGDVWEFSTIGYLVVDDFESYTDDIEADETIWQTWLDGLTNNTGSVVGYFQAPFAERNIVHGGVQSMPMDYNNVNSPYYSEAERSFDPAQDWTVNGLTHLTLFFHGFPTKFLETGPGEYMLSSTSGDVWDTVDHMRLAYKQLTGDGSIVARVDSMTDTWPWAKAGVMIRESFDPGSPHALMALTPEGRTAFQNRLFRTEQSFSAHSAAGAAQFPHWVKLERKGNQITAWHSEDGTNWVLQTNDEGTSPNPVSINMGQSVYVGLMVTSNNLNEACTAEYSGVEMTGAISGSWQVADIGDPIPGNDADTLYVVVEDTAGRSGVVTHPDEAAVLQDTYQAWSIDLNEFTQAGVNVSAVEKLYIGVGDRNAPTPDGAGRLFIDDIRVTTQPTAE